MVAMRSPLVKLDDWIRVRMRVREMPVYTFS